MSKTYRHMELRESYLEKERGRLLKGSESRSSLALDIPEADEEKLFLTSEEIELIREQAAAYCALTLREYDDLSTLAQLHNISRSYVLSRDYEGLMIGVYLINTDGTTTPYYLDKSDRVLKAKQKSSGFTVVKNKDIEDTVRAFAGHMDKLENDRQQEILEKADKYANGDQLLRGILEIHFNFRSYEKPDAHLVETNKIKNADGISLPENMAFYQVGRNASHEFYLGVYEGNIYKYSCGEGSHFFRDEEGIEYNYEQVSYEMKEDDKFESPYLADGRRVYEDCHLDQHISGPYEDISNIGYLGHF